MHVTPQPQPQEGNHSEDRKRRFRVASFVAHIKVVGAELRRYAMGLRRAAFFISVVSLAFSGVSLYETVLKQPRLVIYVGCNWQYGRGQGSFDELFVIPLSIANEGARAGTVLMIELLVDKGREPKAFTGKYTVESLDMASQTLFSPLVIPGHQSETRAIVFTQRQPTNPPLFSVEGRYNAKLKLRTIVDSSYGLIDQLFASPPPEAAFAFSAKGLGPMASGATITIDICA